MCNVDDVILIKYDLFFKYVYQLNVFVENGDETVAFPPSSPFTTHEAVQKRFSIRISVSCREKSEWRPKHSRLFEN